MFDQLLSVIKLRQEMPDAFGYDIGVTEGFPPLPDDIKSAISDEVNDQLEVLTTTFVRIDNYSNKTKRCIRIFYSGNFVLKPNIYFKHPSAELTDSIKFRSREICLDEIPPYETVFIQLYNVSRDFAVEKVVVDDQRVTPLMQKLAGIKRDPYMARMNLRLTLLTAVTSIFVVLVLGFAAYSFWNLYKDKKIYDEANSQFSSCSPEIFHNSLEKEKELERRFYQLGRWGGFTLRLNKVQDVAALKLKDTVILCVPNQD